MQGENLSGKDGEGSGRSGWVVGLAQAGRHPARSGGATRAGPGERVEPHMLCGLRAHMLETHTSTCACIYIYTDIHERDYYRYRFTYTVNTSNYCGILKAAESAPDIRKCLSLSLPSEPVPLVGLLNATCQSPMGGSRAVHLPHSAQCPRREQSIFPGHAHIPQPGRDPGGYICPNTACIHGQAE